MDPNMDPNMDRNMDRNMDLLVSLLQLLKLWKIVVCVGAVPIFEPLLEPCGSPRLFGTFRIRRPPPRPLDRPPLRPPAHPSVRSNL